MLKVEDLRVSYGGIEAVKGISFEVPEKSIVTLIGSNGAGKSTTLRTICGLVKPAGGRIFFDGQDITNMPAEKLVAGGLGMTPEGRKIFTNLSVMENIRIGAYLRKDDISSDVEWMFELFPRLKERSWQRARHAVRRRTADALHRPGADEPSTLPDDGRAVPRSGTAVCKDDF